MPSGTTDHGAAFFGASQDILCVFDPDGPLLEVNEAAQRLTGLSREQLLSRRFLELVHPDDRRHLSLELGRVSAEGGSFSAECRVPGDGAPRRWLSWSCGRRAGSVYASARDVTARKLTEAALLENERALRRILDLAPMPMAIVSLDGAIECINARASKTFGYRRENAPDMEHWLARAYPDPEYRAVVRERWKDAAGRAAAGEGEIEGSRYQVTCWDGTLKTVFVSGVAAAGRIFVMFDDITDRSRTEEALRESETTLRRILDHMPVAVGIQDMNGGIEYVNRKFVQTFGYSAGEIPDVWRWAELAYPDKEYRGEVLRTWRNLIDRAALGDGQMEGWEYKVRCKDGSERAALIFGVISADKLITIFDDITERVRAEAALRDSEARYRTLLETTGTGYVMLDFSGTVLDSNQEYARLTGHESPAEIAGRSVLDWTAVYEKGRNAAALRQCVRDGYVKNLEMDYSGADGAVIPVEINASTVSSGGGRRILALCRDITRRRLADEEIRALNSGLEKRVADRTAELTAANRELEREMEQRVRAEKAKEKLQEELLQSQKMEALGRLAGGIAHDFNNILGGISGYAEFLLKTVPEGAPARDDIEEILQQTGRGAALTRQLLTVSRKQPLALKEVDLNASVLDARSMLKRLIGVNMRMETALSPDAWRITADAGQVGQVIMNLVINARDAMPDGGLIAIETRNVRLEDGGPGMKLAPARGDYVMLSVRDTGCGMPPGTVAHLFEPFFTTKEPGKGTGLGLSTVYGIMSQAGGGIEVESFPGSGTVLRLYFQRAAAVPFDPGDGQKI